MPPRILYVNDVKRGLRYILSLQHGLLQHMAIGLQNVGDPVGHPGDNPEVGQASPNGYGLRVQFNSHEVYLSGQLIDALVSSGTPDKTAETGQATYVQGRTYKEIVQDLLDGYRYGMNDTLGGWHYTYNAGDNDTSSSHWWAIGVLAGEVWGLDAPQWVKTRQKNIGIPKMQIAPPQTNGCYFGYTGNFGNFWGDNQTNVTAGGLILMNADDVPQTDARFQCGMKWLDYHYNSVNSAGNFYTMFQTAKAMRTARNGSGGLQEIELLNGTRSWYNDYADYLINNQNSFGTGEFRAVTGGIGPGYIQGNLATSWGVIILSPSLFELPPAAACVADPNSLGTAGGLVNFSAAGSTHPDANASIVSYAWDFGDGNTVAANASAMASHTYGNPGTFPTIRQAKVTVTDSNGLTDSAFCPVTIVDTNVPPNANTGGPYSMCMGAPLTLDGSTSTDSDGTVTAYSWIWGSNPNFNAPNATTATVNATAAFTALGPGTYSLGLQVTDDLGAKNAEFSTVTVLAASNAACNQPPDAVDDAATTFSGTPVAVSVLANDTDPDVPADTIVVTETTQGANGSVTTNGTTATYTPNLGFFGTDSFTYTIGDGKGGTDTATVTIAVNLRPATVTAGSGTKVFSDVDPSMTPSATGFVDAITLSQTRDAGEDVGSYATNASAAGATLANYDITYVAGSLAITPAASTTVITCTPSVVYTGAAQEVCTANVTGAGGLNAAVSPVTYTDNINVGTASASANYAGDLNHTASSDTEVFAITPAGSITVVSCTPSVVYNGAAQEVCTANVTGVGGLNEAVTPVSYSDNTNVGTAGASASYGGDANHIGSSDTEVFAITPAGSITVVSCTPSVVYNGAAQEVCTANVTGVGGLNEAVTPVGYSDNTNVGTAGASASYGGDANHTGSSDTEVFAITPAGSTTVVSCTPSVVYNGAAQEVCTANVTGVGGLNEAVTPVSYSDNTNVGTAGATATYEGDANHSGSTGSSAFEITAAPTSASVTAPTITYAANGLVTVTVTSGSGTVLGNVSLTVDGGAPMTQTLAAGSTTFTLSSPNAGDHALVATYAAQGNFQASSATGNLHVNQSPTATTLTSTPSPQAAGQIVTLTATVVAVAPGSGVPNGTVTFNDGSTTLGTAAVNGAGVAVFTTTSLAVGPHSITATYSGSSNYLTSAAGAVSQLIYGYPTGGGTFVIGDNNDNLGGSVTFWGAQWEKLNSMTGGGANASFKGFATGPTPPTVGATFTAAPGNSAPSPAAVPEYIGIIVTSKVTKSGSNITGTIVGLVVVKVNPGYAGNPGNAGTGTIVAILP